MKDIQQILSEYQILLNKVSRWQRSIYPIVISSGHCRYHISCSPYLDISISIIGRLVSINLQASITIAATHRVATHPRRVPSVTFHDRCQHPMCQQGFNNYARQSQKVNKHYIHAQGTVTIMSPMSTGSKEACGQLFQLTSGRTRTRSSEEIFLQTFETSLQEVCKSARLI